jgi:hypothetical protein
MRLVYSHKRRTGGEMQKIDKTQVHDHLLDLTAEALQGKQSVRVTFRLPEEAIALLSRAANQLGVKQKSLFDQLIENQEILNRVADEGPRHDISHDERVQKTYVISRNSLIALKKIARQNDISRDLLVELSINRLRPVINAEHEKHKNWKNVHCKVDELLQHGRKVLTEAADIIGKDDQVYKKLEGLINSLEKGHQEINQLIERGKPAG